MLRNIFALILFFALTVGSASAYEVSAIVTDSVGEALPYATYRIFTDKKTEKPLISNTSAEDGSIKQSIEKAGTYRIQISYVGMSDRDTTFSVNSSTPTAKLGNIALSEANEMLQDVTVTAQKPLVVKEIDRIGYDVQADPDAKTSQLSDILRKVPMLSVDSDGTIKVNGSSDFKIYKNGRPNNSMSKNAKDIFKALPASMIKKVEVITEPGAEYDAEGTTAILNIITDDDVSIKGVLGSANVWYNTQNEYPRGNLWMTSEIDKVTFSVNGGYNKFGGKSGETRYEQDNYYKNGTHIHNDGESKTDGSSSWFGIDSSWQPDTLNLFTAEASGYYYDINSVDGSTYIGYDALGNQTSGYRTMGKYPYSRYFDINASANYQRRTHRKGETLTLSYLYSHTDQSSKSETFYLDVFKPEQIPYSAILSKSKLDFSEHTLQADYTRKFGIHTLSVGAKGIFRRNHSNNDNNYVGLNLIETEFKHNTDVTSAYAQYSAKFGKFGFRSGLRYEYSYLKASYPDGSADSFSAKLSDLVPSAALSWQVNDANSLNLNYSSSISRPGISYLNPAVSTSPTTVSFGNPDLSSAMRHSMKLSYMLIKPKINLQLSTSYDFSNDGIAGIRYVEDDIIYRTYGNVGQSRRLSFNAYMQWTITPKTRFMLNGGTTYRYAEQEGMSLDKWSYNFYAQLRQTLPWNIESEIYAWASDNYMDGVYSYIHSGFSNVLSYGISFSKGLLKEKRLNLRLSLENPFGKSNRFNTNYTVNGDYTGQARNYHNYQDFSVSFSVSYRFGSLNAQVKKVDKAIQNDDLIGRKNE